MHAYRTHNCGALKAENIGETVKLSGWVHRTRDHGQLVFIDLRDHYGITQCVAEQDHAAFETLTHLKNESVVTIEGEVVKRDDEAINKELATGDVEIKISAIHVESVAEPLPLQVNADGDFPEATRLKYRFLDMRREKLHNNITLRASIIQELRWSMIQQNFTYMLAYVYVSETPYFATTDAEGKFSIDQLPAEAFELKLWHPSFKLRAAKAATQLTITPGQQTLPPLTLGVKAATPPPTPDALQQRMNKFYDDDYLEF